ncbi:Oxygen regulatory protein NreC [compost metagenome]
MKFLIVDDHPVISEGLKMALTGLSDQNICYSAGSIAEALDLYSKELPQFLIIDHELPDGDGHALVKKIKAINPYIEIAIFTQTLEVEPIKIYLGLNVRGIVHKSSTFMELSSALSEMIRGKNHYSPVIETALKEGPTTHPLTKRELEIVRELVLGKSNKQIGHVLECSEETIKTHKSNIMRKLNLSTSVEICVWAIKNKIV